MGVVASLQHQGENIVTGYHLHGLIFLVEEHQTAIADGFSLPVENRGPGSAVIGGIHQRFAAAEY
ncbi:MAG: hypothetical protein AAF289_02745 [Cyanobacteria bacterium P01_A01_bin.135]